jgi:hypothetical protein
VVRIEKGTPSVILDAIGQLRKFESSDLAIAKPVLIALQKGDNPEIRLAAAFLLLEKVDPTNRESLAVLRQSLSDVAIRRKTVWQMADLGNNTAIVELLLDVASDKQQEAALRHLALSALRRVGPSSAIGVKKLLPCLDEAYPINSATADVFGAIGPGAKEVVPNLEGRIRADRTRLQVNLAIHSMACAVVRIQPDNDEAMRYILRLLNSSNYEITVHGVSACAAYDKLPPAIEKELGRLAAESSNQKTSELATRMLETKKDR